MAAITASVQTGVRSAEGVLKRWYGTSAANQGDTLSTDTQGTKRLRYVYATYSAAPTQAGVTITLDSGLGAAFDVLLHTGSSNGQYTVYTPDEDIWLFQGDALVVSMPAAGGVITGSAVIVCETRS